MSSVRSTNIVNVCYTHRHLWQWIYSKLNIKGLQMCWFLECWFLQYIFIKQIAIVKLGTYWFLNNQSLEMSTCPPPPPEPLPISSRCMPSKGLEYCTHNWFNQCDVAFHKLSYITCTFQNVEDNTGQHFIFSGRTCWPVMQQMMQQMMQKWRTWQKKGNLL